MNYYETVFILTPVLSESQVEEAVKKFESVLTDLGAKVDFKENWGLKKLAYPIQHKRSGFYHLFQFSYEGDVNIIEKLEIAYKRDERVMRFITVKLDKYALTYAQVRREKLKTKKQQP